MAAISRKWRVGIGLAVACSLAVGAYALAGFVVAPYFVQTRLWPLLSEKLGGHFQAARTAFNPFSLFFTVDGLSLGGADGKPLATIGELSFEVEGWASLRSQALVLGNARLVQPSIHILLDSQGKPNFAFLSGSETPQDAPPSKPFPFLLTEVEIEQGQLDFEDQSRGKGFKKTFSAFNARLDNLGTTTDTPAHFKLGAQGENQELLTGEVDWHLATMALAGEFKVQGLGLAPLATWLAADLPYTVASGSLSLTLKYRYAPDTDLELSFAEAQIQQLSLTQAGQPFFAAQSITAKDFSFQQKTNQIELKSLGLETPALQLATPLAAEAISVQGLSFQAKTRRIEAHSLVAAKLKIDQDAQPLAQVGAVAATGFVFMTADGKLDLDSLKLDKVELKTGSPKAVADSIAAQGLSYEMKAGRAAWKSLTIARLKLDQDAQPLAEIAAIGANGLVFVTEGGKLALERLSLDQIDLKTPSPLVDKEGKPRQYNIASIGLDSLAVEVAKKTLQLGGVQSAGSALAFWVEQDGSPGYAGVPKSLLQNGKGSATQTPPKPWQVQVDRVELNDNDIVLRDFSQNPPSQMRLSNLSLLVKQFDSAAPKPFWVGINTGLSSNGRIALEGQVKLAPLTANLKLYVDDLSLPPFQSYIDPAVRVRVVKGMMNLNADIDYDSVPSPKLRIGGDVAVANFASDDKKEGRDFVNWKGLRLNGLIFETAPQRLSIRDITATEPYVRAFIDADKKFNIAENLSPPNASPPAPVVVKPQPAPADKKKPAPAAKPALANKAEAVPAVVIGAFNIRQGNASFADMTIKPVGFAAEIHDLNGNIRSLSSRQDAKSDVLFEGKLNQGSAVKIFGKVNPFSILAYTDISMHFNGVNLTTLSPYSAKFAGYRIEKGKLSMDLRYQLEDGQLTADNSFVLDQLELGERVDSPEATTLPVNLAISLLKDSSGKIDINLPISGDLSNPNISIWGLLSNAASSLLTKVVSAPFSILGSLLGSSAEELEAVTFAPGSTALSNPEKEQLAMIAKVLKDRPALNLEIKGAADQELDRPVLAEMDLTRQLNNAKLIEIGRRKGKKAEWDGALSEEDYQRLFTNLYRWKNSDAAELQGLKAGASLTGSLLESAKRKLLEKWIVSDMDLRGLAQARGESIRLYLVQEQGLPDQRIYLSDVKFGAKEGREIKAVLSLSGS